MDEEGEPPSRRKLVKCKVELEDPVSRKNWVVNGQRLKLYLGGEIERVITIILLKEL